jgi:antitoxin HicB
MRNDTGRKDLKFYLNLRYPITIHSDPDGGYVAEIEELPGCMTQAETLDEAFKAIEDARQVWIQGTYEMGQDIPLPRDMEEYSGKFLVRIPRSLHRNLVRSAKREGVSLNQYIASLLAAGVQGELMGERDDFFESEVLGVAASKPDLVVFDDFSKLRPSNKAGGFYLFKIKEILKRSGFTCHEAGKRQDWGNCGYSGNKTHFHRSK